ncbi:MAG: flagellar assembly protein FliX [Rhodospirillales bacterium]|nr:flagellar assembly protein FliX [Rhodospirillales bacterium]
MKISNIRTAKLDAAAKGKKAKGTSGAKFSDHLDRVVPAISETETVGDSAPVAPVASILVAQEVRQDKPSFSRGVWIRHGEDLLDRLEEIRDQILMGEVSNERLENLANLLRTKRAQVDDPALIALIDEIELRAAVEIAKLNRSI